MSYPGVPGFDQAQAAYENAHPDDGLCPCHAEHERRECDGGYKLGIDGAYACDHEDCHGDELWWPVRYWISEGYIHNEVQLAFMEQFITSDIEFNDDLMADIMNALDSALAREQQELRVGPFFRSCIVGIEVKK